MVGGAGPIANVRLLTPLDIEWTPRRPVQKSLYVHPKIIGDSGCSDLQFISKQETFSVQAAENVAYEE